MSKFLKDLATGTCSEIFAMDESKDEFLIKSRFLGKMLVFSSSLVKSSVFSSNCRACAAMRFSLSCLLYFRLNLYFLINFAKFFLNNKLY